MWEPLVGRPHISHDARDCELCAYTVECRVPPHAMCAPIKAAATGERVLELRVACVVAKRRTSLPFIYNPKANVKPACGEMD